MFKFKKKLSKSDIKKSMKVGDTEIQASYNPHSGLFKFKRKRREEPYSAKTGPGAFKTMRALINAYETEAPEKIVYSTIGETQKEVEIKDRLYSRELKRLNYSLKNPTEELSIKDRLGIIWAGPERIWIREKKQVGGKGLEGAIASVIGIGALTLSLVFFSPTLTGNAIANLTTKTSSLIGAGLFIVGMVGSYFWFKKK